jgi:hypothetical protein
MFLYSLEGAAYFVEGCHFTFATSYKDADHIIQDILHRVFRQWVADHWGKLGWKFSHVTGISFENISKYEI